MGKGPGQATVRRYGKRPLSALGKEVTLEHTGRTVAASAVAEGWGQI